MNRRAFLMGMSALAGSAVVPAHAATPIGAAQASRFVDTHVDLLTCPIDVQGDWGKSLPSSALRVIRRMRDVCLTDVTLASDRQPDDLRVDNHLEGPPHIWLHDKPPDQAWIVVDIGERDWSKLAYQFGHELGHVLCNSWQRTSAPAAPCQWLEESMVEAFSIRGLGKLAQSWSEDPPFPNDNAFGGAIARYRENVMRGYTSGAHRKASRSLAGWFVENRAALESGKFGLDPIEGPAILAALDELETDTACVEDLGAMNRWSERTRLSIGEYLNHWTESCVELGAAGRLPKRLSGMLGLGH